MHSSSYVRGKLCPDCQEKLDLFQTDEVWRDEMLDSIHKSRIQACEEIYKVPEELDTYSKELRKYLNQFQR